MQQLSLFPETKPKLEPINPAPPEVENPDFLDGINRLLSSASLPIRIYSTPCQFNPKLTFKIWHLDAEQPIWGAYSEEEIWELAKAFRNETNTILWRWLKDEDSKKYYLYGAKEISMLIDEIICPDAQLVKEQRKIRFMGHS